MKSKPLYPYSLVSILTWFVCLSWRMQASNASALQDSVEQIGATLMGESALIDRETGRVIWEGRSSSTLSESVHPYLTSRGLNHIKASLLTAVLALVILSYIASFIRNRLDEPVAEGHSPSIPTSLAVFVAQWTILRVPQFDKWFVLIGIGLYLLEAYTCSTKRYLKNAISSTTEVEDYIESLRNQPPIISWKVRSFHYETRKWLLPLLYPIQLLQRNAGDQMQATVPPPFRKKVVTNVEQGKYEYTSCQDSTTSGVWKRSVATSSRSAPFTKITLCKRIVLTNAKARQDYFSQQAKFVTEQGQRDEFAEFATNIDVKGFNSRMLAVRAVEGVPSAKLFRIQLFWLFTLLGLGLPYRIWFARHCEEVRVTVVKETSSEKKSSSWTSKGWFSRKIEENNDEEELFRRKMQDLALYRKSNENASATEDDVQLLEDMEVARLAANLTNGTLTRPPIVTNVDSNEPNATVPNATVPKTNKITSQSLNTAP